MQEKDHRREHLPTSYKIVSIANRPKDISAQQGREKFSKRTNVLPEEQPRFLEEAYNGPVRGGQQQYFADIRELPILPPEIQFAFASQVQKGIAAERELQDKGEELSAEEKIRLKSAIDDKIEAQRQLVESNLRLVAGIANKLTGHGVPLLDLIQEGNLGVMKATEKFNSEEGVKFSTFAHKYAKGYMLNAIAENGRTIRVARHVYRKLRTMRHILSELPQQLGRTPHVSEIIKAVEDTFGVNEETAKKYLQLLQDPASLYEKVGEDGELELGDTITSPDDGVWQESVEQRADWGVLPQILRILDEVEKIVIERYYLSDAPPTIEALASELKISVRKVEQAKENALRKIRLSPHARKLPR